MAALFWGQPITTWSSVGFSVMPRTLWHTSGRGGNRTCVRRRPLYVCTLAVPSKVTTLTGIKRNLCLTSPRANSLNLYFFMTKSKICSSYGRRTGMQLVDPGLLESMIHALHLKNKYKKRSRSIWTQFKEKKGSYGTKWGHELSRENWIMEGFEVFHKSFSTFSYHKSRSGWR